MNLSDRLQVIADQINKGETMADIGTDHGFLPLYLWENDICPKTIMADISIGSLNKAKDNCRLLFPDELDAGVFDIRLGDGIKVIENGEVDVICIAGMGGILMSEILGDDLDKSHSFKRIIMQPRTNPGILRHFLLTNGFQIVKESLVREGKYICEIITATPCDKSFSCEYSPEFDYPTSLIEFKNSLTEEYLTRALNKEEFILNSLSKGKTINYIQKNTTEKRIEIINKLLSEL